MTRPKGAKDRTPRQMPPRVQLYNERGERWCSGHADYLPLANPAERSGATFGNDKRGASDGLARYCRACVRYVAAQQYQRHRPTRDAKTLRWRERHPQAWRKQHAVSNRVWRLSREMDAQARLRLQEELGA